MVSYFPFFNLLFLLTFWWVSPSESQKEFDLKPLKQKFEEIKSHPNTKDAQIAFLLLEPSANRVLFEQNATSLLTPASALKIITTASAMYLLDTTYQFQTRLEYTGLINEDGYLSGDLIIKGGGDPTLASPFINSNSAALDSLFAQWLKAIKLLGINQVGGNIVGDASFFDHQLVPDCWDEDDIGNYYGAGACGLTIHENFFTLYFQPGKKQGHSAKLSGTSPPTAGLLFNNQVTTGPKGSGDKVIVYGGPFENTRLLTGTVPLGQDSFPVRGSHPDPAFWASALFSEYLIKNGIEIHGKVLPGVYTSSHPKGKAIPITQTISPPLKVILERTNKRSVNTYAENLLKAIGKIHKNEGSYAAGLSTVKTFWASKGIDTLALEMKDGSGLSRQNKISAAALGQILSFIYHDADSYSYFKSTLSVAGQSGTLERAFSGSAAKDRIWAKSGFMRGVRSYAGYASTQNGQILVFVFMVNDFKGPASQVRQQMTALIETITKLE